MYCNNCGEKLKKDAKFCPKCGHKVDYSSRMNSKNNDEINPKTNLKSPKGDLWSSDSKSKKGNIGLHSTDLWNSDSKQNKIPLTSPYMNTENSNSSKEDIPNVTYAKSNQKNIQDLVSNQNNISSTSNKDYNNFKNVGNSSDGEIDYGPAKVILALIVCCCIGLFIFGNIGSLLVPDQNTENLSSSVSLGGTAGDDIADISNDNSGSSTPRLGSKENPKTSRDYVNGNYGDINPNYGDYYYIDGALWRDDNKYIGGAGTFTFISGKNPYAYSSSSYYSSGSGSSSSSSSSSSSFTTNHDNEYHKYFASKRSNKFHETYCSQGSKIKNSNRIYYNSRREALNDGKKPCKHCQP